MPQKLNPISKFWQELKRRRVVHVITVYASASFVLIELVNNLTEPLNLPPKLATIAVVVLAVGFPLAVILAWIYDLTPEGIEKTMPSTETEDAAKTKVPNVWRIATLVSFVVIVGLVSLNILGGSNGLKAGEYDKAFACLEELYEQGNLDVPYMTSNFEGYEHFKPYQGYVEMLKKFKLPHPKE